MGLKRVHVPSLRKLRFLMFVRPLLVSGSKSGFGVAGSPVSVFRLGHCFGCNLSCTVLLYEGDGHSPPDVCCFRDGMTPVETFVLEGNVWCGSLFISGFLLEEEGWLRMASYPCVLR